MRREEGCKIVMQGLMIRKTPPAVANPGGGFNGKLFQWKAFPCWNYNLLLRAFISFERSKETKTEKDIMVSQNAIRN